MKIHLIRHGSTIANEKKLYCGQTDLPLSEKGIGEINAYKEMGIYPKCPGLYFTSSLTRTKQTLGLIYGPMAYESLPELAEFNFGQFEMKSYEELKEQPDYQAWAYDDSGLIACPGGEYKQQFTKRILEGFDLLVERTLQNKASDETLLVSHGGVIVGIMEYLFPNIHHFYEWQPVPGRGYTLTQTQDKFWEYQKI